MNISNYLQTLRNPKGMFLTLGDNVTPRLNKRGEIDFFIENRTIYFKVRINRVKHIMWCFIGDKLSTRQKFKDINLLVKKLKSPHLVTWKFLHDEILVLDDLGRFQYADIIIQKEINGCYLSEFLKSTQIQQNPLQLQTLIKNLGLMFSNLFNQGINFKGIDFRKLQVQNNLSVAIAASPRLNIIDKDTKDTLSQEDYNTLFCQDNTHFAALISLLAMLIVMPNYFATMGTISLLRMHNLKNLLPQIKTVANKIQFSELAQLTDCAISGQREQISELINQISNKDLKNILKQSSECDFNEVFTASCLSDFSVREDNKGYYFMYIPTREKAFGLNFDYAENFVLERAVVGIKGKFALINTKGEYLISPLADDITWHARANLAVVQKNEHYYLFDGNGQRIGDTSYDYIGELSEDLLLVKLSDKYGYINTSGQVIINCNYIDALPVNHSQAKVNDGNKWANIQTNPLCRHIHKT